MGTRRHESTCPTSGQDRRLGKLIDQPLGRPIASALLCRVHGYLDLDPVPQQGGANQTSPSRMRRAKAHSPQVWRLTQWQFALPRYLGVGGDINPTRVTRLTSRLAASPNPFSIGYKDGIGQLVD